MDAYLPDAVLLGQRFEPDMAVLVGPSDAGAGARRIVAVRPAAEVPDSARRHRLQGLLAPGYVEIQINGCGGVIFTESPTAEAIRRMDDVLSRRGVTSFLPTLITAPDATIDAGLSAVRSVMAERPSVLGMHLEGPHLSLAKPGTHAQDLIRAMGPADLDRILGAAQDRSIRLLTFALENVGRDQIDPLAASGITLALGHTAASAAQVIEAHARGVAMLTHLYNGMPPLAGREPGPVGAAFASDTLAASIIPDGHHVDDVAIRTAARALGDRLVMTSDATASIEGGEGPFVFGGYNSRIENGVVRNHLGGLAGAATLLDELVPRMAWLLEDPGRAAWMASEGPARLIGATDEVGRLAAGLRADFVLLDADTLALRAVWRGGERVASPDRAALPEEAVRP